MDDITVRVMRFDFPEVIDPMIVRGDPEESYETVALSLLLPYLEPYIIRTMKAARKHVTDPALRTDLDRFCAQEGQHYRQHKRFNDAVRAYGLKGLDALEAELDADYQRFSATKSLRWNLAYAEGFEALTTAVAHFSFETKAFERIDASVRDLWHWHLVEELEHRAVAFEVYDHVVGSYFYRLWVGIWAQLHMLRWIRRTSRAMLAADPRTLEGVDEAKRLRSIRLRLLRRHLLPKVLRIFGPRYTPRVLAMTPAMTSAAADYTARAIRTSATEGDRARD
jgi:predicted metal-dependent hydrolase